MADSNQQLLSDEIDRICAEIKAEVMRATLKFPTWPTDVIHASMIVQEESGELAKAALQRTYEKQKASWEDVSMEALQTGAMAVRFLLSMKDYTATAGEQHKQGEER